MVRHHISSAAFCDVDNTAEIMLYIKDISQDVWTVNEACSCRKHDNCWRTKGAEVMELQEVRKGVSGHLY